MKSGWLVLLMVMTGPVSPAAAEPMPAETSGGWAKFEGNPVMGGKYGTCFDISVLREDGTYRMWLSWRPRRSVALVESKDGIHWSEPPVIALSPRKSSGWEDDINRPCVLKKGGTYHMWYTGQVRPGEGGGRSWIGYATSPDGVTWKRMSDKPVLSSEKPWEKVAVMCPHVLWDGQLNLFRMWYSGGEQGEPNAIGYATSPDGLTWTKHEANPIFAPDPTGAWEKHKVTACQVIRQGQWHVMFYIGFRDESTAQIGIARSKDGITGWRRHSANPIVRVGKGKWDHDACYKPYAVYDGRKWLLWYNGRQGGLEQIGLVTHEGEDLGFDQTPTAQYKVAALCGVKVNLDKQGKLLSRYEPDTPGAGYVQAVQLAVGFLKTCPNDPASGLPLYMTYGSLRRSQDGGFQGAQWPHNPATVNAGMVQSLAIDWRNYSGDRSLLAIVRRVLDHHIRHGTTSENWQWPCVPYASSDAGKVVYQGSANFDGATRPEDMGRGDGSFVLEVDKIGDMGMAYLRFYQITDEAKYLQAAIHCADALAGHVRKGPYSSCVPNTKSRKLIPPWPFRVRAEKGEILEEYTSHVVDNLRLLEELLRIKDRIQLSFEKAQAYKNAAEIVWCWLYAADGPVKTSVWKGYFEDMPLDPLNQNRVNNSPMELARYLIKNPGHDPNIETTVPALIRWVKRTLGEPGIDAINEQLHCRSPMGSHTARYASICALWYERTGDERFKEEAYRHFNYASYMAEPDGVVQVGHNWGGTPIWFSDGYTDYIRHFMDGLAAVPEWAPAGENHLLRSSSVVQSIVYSVKEIAFTTFDDGTTAVLRLSSKPASVKARDKSLMLVNDEKEEGYTWKPLARGGVLKVRTRSGNTVSIQLE